MLIVGDWITSQPFITDQAPMLFASCHVPRPAQACRRRKFDAMPEVAMQHIISA